MFFTNSSYCGNTSEPRDADVSDPILMDGDCPDDWREDGSVSSNCTFLTYEEQVLIFNVKFWLEGVAQV